MNTVQFPKQVSRFGIGDGKTFGAGAYESHSVQCATELGLWLGGLVSFLDPANRFFCDGDGPERDRTKEMRVIQSALVNCSRKAFDLEGAIRQSGTGISEVTVLEAAELAGTLREFVVLGQAHLQGPGVPFAVWGSWGTALRRGLKAEAVRKLVAYAEAAVAADLPAPVGGLLSSDRLPGKWNSDLKLVIPRIATVMGYLAIVRQMLENDVPLKTSILMFARVDDLVREMTLFINNRLLRFADDSDALFGSLDAAAYTASIELRKVYSSELKGLLDIRPTPLVYARIETAYALLNDSLQMTLVNFVQLVDRDVEPIDVFPNLLTKEQQSIQLRENMWHLLQTVQKAEQDPESCPPEAIRKELTDFRDKNLYFLFYKDMETVDRFIEEVLITSEKKDLVPLLHRFGAYLETLLGQVNMRVVLANHPFEPLERQAHELLV